MHPRVAWRARSRPANTRTRCFSTDGEPSVRRPIPAHGSKTRPAERPWSPPVRVRLERPKHPHRRPHHRPQHQTRGRRPFPPKRHRKRRCLTDDPPRIAATFDTRLRVGCRERNVARPPIRGCGTLVASSASRARLRAPRNEFPRHDGPRTGRAWRPRLLRIHRKPPLASGLAHGRFRKPRTSDEEPRASPPKRRRSRSTSEPTGATRPGCAPFRRPRTRQLPPSRCTAGRGTAGSKESRDSDSGLGRFSYVAD
jgi:hypothetical protein